MEQIQTRFYLYEPNSKLFLKRDGIVKYWSVSDIATRAFAALTADMHESYSATSQKEADDFRKAIINDCGFGTNRGKDELAKSGSRGVDNSSACVIINVKWFVVQDVICTYVI